MMQTLVGIGMCAALVVFFVLTYHHKEGGCTGTGNCSSCNGAGHCSVSESDNE